MELQKIKRVALRAETEEPNRRYKHRKIVPQLRASFLKLARAHTHTHPHTPFGKLKFIARKDQRLLMQHLKYHTD